MAFNRLVDRTIDAANPRTASRHLASGRLSVRAVVVFTIASASLFVAGTFLFWPNPWPPLLAGPTLLILLGYSYAKRFTSGAHAWLGVALGLSPVASWLALRGSLAAPPIFLGVAVLFWVAGFDVIYACQDVEFDRGAGLHSLPSRVGVRTALRLAALSHALMLLALVALGVTMPMGGIFWVGVLAAALLLVVEHALVRPDNLQRVNVAFFHVNVAISLGLLVVGVADLISRQH